ncbi:MAG: DUF4387 family protein [Pseudomonadota bacterium]
MPLRVADVAASVRSKNAGPFWLTIDVFFASQDAFEQVRDGLDTEAVAARYGTVADRVERYVLDDLRVIKFSLPRPAVQGTLGDRDMHGAGFASLLAEMQLQHVL